MDSRSKRLVKEIAECERDKTLGIVVEPIDGNLSHLKGTFPGPSGTPYEGGRFEVDIIAPPTYPFVPLTMKFINKVYHPNISSQSGAICLDILKDKWSPVLTLKTAIVSLQSLLCSPEPNDPQDAEVAKHYMSDREDFERTARYWTEVYAMDKGQTSEPSRTAGSRSRSIDDVRLSGLDPANVTQFVSMGFDRAKVIEALSRLNYRGANITNISDETVIDRLLS